MIALFLGLVTGVAAGRSCSFSGAVVSCSDRLDRIIAAHDVASTADSGASSCVLLTNGQVLCWTEDSEPVAMALDGKAVLLTGSSQNFCAALAGGVVDCWEATNRPTRVISELLEPLSDFSVTADSVCFVEAGQIQRRCVSCARLPVSVQKRANLDIYLASGDSFTCWGVGSIHLLWCWGQGSDGQLGTGSTSDAGTSSMTLASTNVGVTFTALIGGPTANHICVITTSSYLTCWGDNTKGQLGIGTTTDATKPGSYATWSSGSKILVQDGALGYRHSCFVMGDGSHEVYCWGEGAYGQLGLGSTTDHNRISLGVGSWSNSPTKIVAGAAHTCVLLSTGRARCWGRNNFGQLGTNNLGENVGDSAGEMNSLTDMYEDISGAQDTVISGVVDISAGYWHTCILSLLTWTSARYIYCTGINNLGQLGDGTTSDRDLAKKMFTADSSASFVPRAIFLTRDASCMFDTNKGQINCWGDGNEGTLANGLTQVLAPSTSWLTSAAVTSSSSISIQRTANGGDHFCILDSNFEVKCWGGNSHGQIGVGSTTNSKTSISALLAPVLMDVSSTCTVGGACWIDGAGFGTSASKLTVKVGSTSTTASSVSQNTYSSQLKFTTPTTLATGTYSVTVTRSSYGTSNSLSLNVVVGSGAGGDGNNLTGDHHEGILTESGKIGVGIGVGVFAAILVVAFEVRARRRSRVIPAQEEMAQRA
eukprot:TRINITY_DN4180_c0_g1_i1.p1 TRINITY_DN4180_c0_g1~~TRINITY_DN4180_c0_g1_i1.p1  ORF type:complete len:716 (+),score=105.84 TRINITY_DN4180_c0_g1_i1:32-2149(+)